MSIDLDELEHWAVEMRRSAEALAPIDPEIAAGNMRLFDILVAAQAELRTLRAVRDAARAWRKHRPTWMSASPGETALCAALDACKETTP